MYCTLPKTITIVIDRNHDNFGYSTALYLKQMPAIVLFCIENLLSIQNSTFAVTCWTFSPPLPNGTVQYLEIALQRFPYRTVPKKEFWSMRHSPR